MFPRLLDFKHQLNLIITLPTLPIKHILFPSPYLHFTYLTYPFQFIQQYFHSFLRHLKYRKLSIMDFNLLWVRLIIRHIGLFFRLILQFVRHCFHKPINIHLVPFIHLLIHTLIVLLLLNLLILIILFLLLVLFITSLRLLLLQIVTISFLMLRTHPKLIFLLLLVLLNHTFIILLYPILIIYPIVIAILLFHIPIVLIHSTFIALFPFLLTIFL